VWRGNFKKLETRREQYCYNKEYEISMDLSISINGIKLNIRVTVLLETPKGFVFEKDKSGFYFPVGPFPAKNHSTNA